MSAQAMTLPTLTLTVTYQVEKPLELDSFPGPPGNFHTFLRGSHLLGSISIVTTIHWSLRGGMLGWEVLLCQLIEGEKAKRC